MDADPDPGGPKPYGYDGSGFGSGSATLMVTCLCEGVKKAGLQPQVNDWAGEGIGGDTLHPHPLPHSPDMTRDVVQIA
jgi:hypothetical protein